VQKVHTLSDTTAFVTSYNINHNDLTISARIITATAGVQISNEDWFELCDNSTPGNVREAIQAAIKANLAILVKSNRSPVPYGNADGPERVALDTLREMISEADFRQYLRGGFVIVRGRSGRVYQIFRDRQHTKIYDGGRLVEELCVGIKPAVPKTDNVIALMVMAQANEDELRAAANVYNMRKAA
jgi:hypothetical protein